MLTDVLGVKGIFSNVALSHQWNVSVIDFLGHRSLFWGVAGTTYHAYPGLAVVAGTLLVASTYFCLLLCSESVFALGLFYSLYYTVKSPTWHFILYFVIGLYHFPHKVKAWFFLIKQHVININLKRYLFSPSVYYYSAASNIACYFTLKGISKWQHHKYMMKY